VKGPILCLKAHGKSFFEFLEEIGSSTRIIVLTDFDTEGKKLAKMLVNELSKKRIDADDSIWRQVGALIRQDIHTVQDLGSCIEGMQVRVRTVNDAAKRGRRLEKPYM